MADHEVLRIDTDELWHCSTNEVNHWEDLGFEDRDWSAVKIIARYGEGPWGRIGPKADDSTRDPQCAGILGVVRVIYVPENRPVELRQLNPGTNYKGQYFDPVTGESATYGHIRADQQGTCICASPKGQAHDWVLVVR